MTNAPPEPHATGTPEALLSRLRGLCSCDDASLALREAFEEPGSETRGAIAALEPLLPDNEVETIKWCESLGLTEIECVFVFLASLRKLRTSNGWIHYNLSDRLYKLFLFGHREARLPAIVHAQCAAAVLNTPNGHVRPFTILAHLLDDVAPREAIDYGLRAGNVSVAAGALRHFGLGAPGPTTTLADAETIATALRFPGSYRHVRVQQAHSASESVAIEEDTARFGRPEGDAEHYIFATAEKRMTRPAIRIHTFSEAEFAIDAAAAGVEQHYLRDAQGRCVVEFCNGITPFRDPPVRLDKPVAVLDDRFSGTMNICHFLLDHVTRIHLYDRVSGGDCLFFAVDQFRYYREIIEILGLGNRFVEVPSRRITISAPQILMSSNTSKDFRHPAHLCAPWAIGFLRSKLCVAPARAPARRWYISRSDARGRSVVNEDAVKAVLRRHGFEDLVLSGRSAAEQIRLFSEAEAVIGVHGAGLTNVLFAPPTCKVLEILPPLVATPAYWMLATSIGQRYRALIGDDLQSGRPDYKTWSHNPIYNNRNLVVPIDRLEAALAAL